MTPLPMISVKIEIHWKHVQNVKEKIRSGRDLCHPSGV
jgi:hypothetical protein